MLRFVVSVVAILMSNLVFSTPIEVILDDSGRGYSLHFESIIKQTQRYNAAGRSNFVRTSIESIDVPTSIDTELTRIYSTKSETSTASSSFEQIASDSTHAEFQLDADVLMFPTDELSPNGYFVSARFNFNFELSILALTDTWLDIDRILGFSDSIAWSSLLEVSSGDGGALVFSRSDGDPYEGIPPSSSDRGATVENPIVADYDDVRVRLDAGQSYSIQLYNTMSLPAANSGYWPSVEQRGGILGDYGFGLSFSEIPSEVPEPGSLILLLLSMICLLFLRYAGLSRARTNRE